jgi:hypothetical protein
MPVTNAEALAVALTAFSPADADQPFVALAQTLAAALDEDPGRAALAKEYREALIALSQRMEAANASFTAAIAAIRDASVAAVGDAAN